MKRNARWIASLLTILILVSLLSSVAYAASGDTIVYRTKTGECYHTKNCSYLKSSYELTLQDAVNRGLRPCSRCHPPTLDSNSSPAKSSPSITSKNTYPAVTSSNAVSSIVYGKGTQFKVSIKANCTKNNSVGNDWSKEYSIGGTSIKSGDIVAFNQNDRIEIKTTIIEYDDSNNDIGTEKTTYKISSTDISKGFTITQTIIVKENGGRYKGNTATWEVEYKFSKP